LLALTKSTLRLFISSVRSENWAGEIFDGVWLSKAGNCMNPSARADIKNFDGLVILCDKEQAVTLEVSRKMFKSLRILAGIQFLSIEELIRLRMRTNCDKEKSKKRQI